MPHEPRRDESGHTPNYHTPDPGNPPENTCDGPVESCGSGHMAPATEVPEQPEPQDRLPPRDGDR